MAIGESKVPAGGSGWLKEELAGCDFKDERLGKRFVALTEQLEDGRGEGIPFACQDWANTKAAYRFFSNDRVNEADILSGHFQSTRERFKACEGPVLIIQDTSYDRLKSVGGDKGYHCRQFVSSLKEKRIAAHV